MFFTDQSVQEAGAGSDQTRGERHHAVDAPPTSPWDLRLHLHPVPLCSGLRPWPPASELLLRAVRAALWHAPQRRWRLLRLRKHRATASHLCGAQQVCHPQRPQTGLHRRHPVQAGVHSRRGKQGDELQQRSVRHVEDCGGGHQNGRPELPQHGRHPGNGGQSHRTLTPLAAVQGAAAAHGQFMIFNLTTDSICKWIQHK